MLSSPKEKEWPILPKDSNYLAPDSKANRTECESVQIANDTDIGNAIFEAIEKSGIVSNNAQTKKKKNKKGTVLFATGLTFEHGK